MLARVLVSKNPITKIGLCYMELHRLLIKRFLPTISNCKSVYSIASLNHRTKSGQWDDDLDNTFGIRSRSSRNEMRYSVDTSSTSAQTKRIIQ